MRGAKNIQPKNTEMYYSNNHTIGEFEVWERIENISVSFFYSFIEPLNITTVFIVWEYSERNLHTGEISSQRSKLAIHKEVRDTKASLHVNLFDLEDDFY